jgi:hypothetical protein
MVLDCVGNAVIARAPRSDTERREEQYRAPVMLAFLVGKYAGSALQ